MFRLTKYKIFNAINRRNLITYKAAEKFVNDDILKLENMPSKPYDAPIKETSSQKESVKDLFCLMERHHKSFLTHHNTYYGYLKE